MSDEELRRAERDGTQGLRALMRVARVHAPWMSEAGVRAMARSLYSERQEAKEFVKEFPGLRETLEPEGTLGSLGEVTFVAHELGMSVVFYEPESFRHGMSERLGTGYVFWNEVLPDRANPDKAPRRGRRRSEP